MTTVCRRAHGGLRLSPGTAIQNIFELGRGTFLSHSHEQDSDLELARSARKGEESAFEEIMRRYSPRVFRFASKFFRQRSLVEEAAQEVFLKAFTELGKL